MSDSTNPIRLSMTSSFLESVRKLPSTVINKTFEFLNRFSELPESRGRNLEKIGNQLMSARIDLAYRAIMFHEETDNTYILLWADHHDEAYAWAERRKVVAIGNTLQIVKCFEKENEPETHFNSLFSNISRRVFLRLGVPDELIQSIKQIESLDDIENGFPDLNSRVREALGYLSAGFSVDEIISELGLADFNQDMIQNISEVLHTPETRQTLITINEDLDLGQLQNMLNQPLEAWRVFLHASQRRIVEGDFSGPVKVVGGAGTGKTITAIHRAKYLVEKIHIRETERILLSTFTVNLAVDIQGQLKKICLEPCLNRIDVMNMYRLVVHLFKKYFPSYQIIYGEEIDSIWQAALNQNQYVGTQTLAFFKEEWSRVIIPQNVLSISDYLKATRIGRGVRLTRPEKLKIWSIFKTYQRLVEVNHKTDMDSALQMLSDALVHGDIEPLYKAIVLDEAQDFNEQTLMFIRALCGLEHANDLFIVGDAHQRIYRNKTALSRCGIQVRGRSFMLRINYRTTEQIRRWAFNLYKDVKVDDLDEQEDDSRGYISLLSGPEPKVLRFESTQAEIEAIRAIIVGITSDPTHYNNICIVVRTGNLLNQYKHALESSGFRMYEIKANNQDMQAISGLRIATMHRVKGLEFDHMILAAINNGILPLQSVLRSASDPVSSREVENTEKALLYVAATRAKKTLHVLCNGKPSKYLDRVTVC